MEEPKIGFSPVNAVKEKGVSVWRFTGLEVYIMTASIIFGFLVVTALIGKAAWPLMTSLLLASVIPVSTAVVLLKWVVGKPKTYLRDYLKWKYLKLTQQPLMEPLETEDEE